jgi:hypothetical protein
MVLFYLPLIEMGLESPLRDTKSGSGNHFLAAMVSNRK